MNGTVSGPRTWTPWETFSRSLPQNIALAAYREPVTLEALSLELGVSRPYVEDEVRLLCERQGIKKQDGMRTRRTSRSSRARTARASTKRSGKRRAGSLLGSAPRSHPRKDASAASGSRLFLRVVPPPMAPGAVDRTGVRSPPAGRIGYRIEYPRRPNGAWFLVGFEAGQDELPLEGGLSVCSDSDPQGGAYRSCIFWTNWLRHWAGHMTLAEARVASRLLGGPVEAAALAPPRAGRSPRWRAGGTCAGSTVG